MALKARNQPSRVDNVFNDLICKDDVVPAPKLEVKYVAADELDVTMRVTRTGIIEEALPQINSRGAATSFGCHRQQTGPDPVQLRIALDSSHAV